jgi:hypothetical protein
MSCMESLEARCLFSGTRLVPELSGSLEIKKAVYGLPGETIGATLTIANSGGRLASNIPIGIYVTSNFSVSGLTPLKIISKTLVIRKDKSRKVQLSFTLPVDSVLPAGQFDVLANINDNNEGETVAAAGSSSLSEAALLNPLATYTGTYTVGSTSEPLTIALSANGSKVQATVSAEGQTFNTLAIPDIRTTFSPVTGNFSLHASGSYSPENISHYAVSVSGILNSATQTLLGTLNISGTIGANAFSDHAIFYVTEIGTT